MTGHEQVQGANFTFTVTALIEGIWFGLGFVFLSGTIITLGFGVDGSPLELFLLRSVGMLAIALGLGCWVARSGDRSTVKMMSMVMVFAKVLSTIILIIMVFSVPVTPLFYINPIFTAFLAIINYRQMSLAA